MRDWEEMSGCKLELAESTASEHNYKTLIQHCRPPDPPSATCHNTPSRRAVAYWCYRQIYPSHTTS